MIINTSHIQPDGQPGPIETYWVPDLLCGFSHGTDSPKIRHLTLHVDIPGFRDLLIVLNHREAQQLHDELAHALDQAKRMYRCHLQNKKNPNAKPFSAASSPAPPASPKARKSKR